MHILRFSRDLPSSAGQFSVVREARVETRLREKLGVRPREYRNCVLFNRKLLRWSRKIALSKDQTIRERQNWHFVQKMIKRYISVSLTQIH